MTTGHEDALSREPRVARPICLVLQTACAKRSCSFLAGLLAPATAGVLRAFEGPRTQTPRSLSLCSELVMPGYAATGSPADRDPVEGRTEGRQPSRPESKRAARRLPQPPHDPGAPSRAASCGSAPSSPPARRALTSPLHDGHQ